MKYRSEMHFQVAGFAAGGVRGGVRKGPDGRVRTATVVVEDRLGHDF